LYRQQTNEFILYGSWVGTIYFDHATKSVTSVGESIDQFVMYFDADTGAFRDIVTLGGPGEDNVVDAVLDQEGNLYIVGSSGLGPYDYITTNLSYNGSILTFPDNSPTVLFWMVIDVNDVYLNGSAINIQALEFYNIAQVGVDSSNPPSLYTYGQYDLGTSSVQFLGQTIGSFGGPDLLLLKFNSIFGNLIYLNYFGSSGPDYSNSLSVSCHHLFFTGVNYAPLTLSSFPTVTVPSGGFIAKIESNGPGVWITPTTLNCMNCRISADSTGQKYSAICDQDDGAPCVIASVTGNQLTGSLLLSGYDYDPNNCQEAPCSCSDDGLWRTVQNISPALYSSLPYQL